MRPAELDVTFSLTNLHVAVTEDAGGDEPYIWILGFKVDADTLLPPGPTNPFVPTLGVQTFVGAPAFPWLTGGNSVDSPRDLPIPPALGVRSMRLRPALLEIGRWFDGFAGVVCLVWDQDAFAPSTSEAGHAAFNKAFGPALSSELQVLLNGDPAYDAALNRDAAGNPLPDPPGGFTLFWRVDRLGDAVALKNVTKALTDRVKGSIRSTIRSAFIDAAGLDEKIDPDDLLGADAAVFSGRSLQLSVQPLALSFTDDEANYSATGVAHGSRVHQPRLTSTVLSSTGTVIETAVVEARVCQNPAKNYTARAIRHQTTLRYQAVDLTGTPPSQVRWFVDQTPLDTANGILPVTLGPAKTFTGSPAVSVASHYPGGPGSLVFSINGATLDLSTGTGDGVFSGEVSAVVGYPGDPSPIPASPVDFATAQNRGYVISDDTSLVSVEVLMDQEYIDDVTACLRKKLKDINVQYIPADWGRFTHHPGDPAPNWRELGVQLDEASRVVAAANSDADRAFDVLTEGVLDVAHEAGERLRTLTTLRLQNVINDDELALGRQRVLRGL